jgi:hypothetical protein
MSQIPKMMLGFIVRRCAVDLGHLPSAEDLASWASQPDEEGLRPFGRSITSDEAKLILDHQSRLVSARSASSNEIFLDDADLPDNVIRLDSVRRRLTQLRARRSR